MYVIFRSGDYLRRQSKACMVTPSPRVMHRRKLYVLFLLNRKPAHLLFNVRLVGDSTFVFPLAYHTVLVSTMREDHFEVVRRVINTIYEYHEYPGNGNDGVLYTTHGHWHATRESAKEQNEKVTTKEATTSVYGPSIYHCGFQLCQLEHTPLLDPTSRQPHCRSILQPIDCSAGRWGLR